MRPPNIRRTEVSMKPEDKVVKEVVAYFSEPKFSEFSIITGCEIQMGTDNREVDIVLRDDDGNFIAIAECKSPGGANYGIPQLKSYLCATDASFGVFAPRIERDSWIFYENLRHNRFQQIELPDFEKGVLKKKSGKLPKPKLYHWCHTRGSHHGVTEGFFAENDTEAKHIVEAATSAHRWNKSWQKQNSGINEYVIYRGDGESIKLSKCLGLSCPACHA